MIVQPIKPGQHPVEYLADEAHRLAVLFAQSEDDILRQILGAVTPIGKAVLAEVSQWEFTKLLESPAELERRFLLLEETFRIQYAAAAKTAIEQYDSYARIANTHTAQSLKTALGGRLSVKKSKVDELSKLVRSPLIQLERAKDGRKVQASYRIADLIELIRNNHFRDFKSRVLGLAQQGAESGLTTGQVIDDLSTFFKSTRKTREGIEAAIKTATTAIQNQAKLLALKKNPKVVRGYRLLVTFDLRTSPECRARADAQWDIDGKPINGTTIPFDGGPPYHYRCRTVMVPLLVENPNVMNIPGRTKAALAQPAPRVQTYEQWLRTQPERYQRAVLGPTLHKLWRRGDLRMRDLIGPDGEKRSVADLVKIAA